MPNKYLEHIVSYTFKIETFLVNNKFDLKKKTFYIINKTVQEFCKNKNFHVPR